MVFDKFRETGSAYGVVHAFVKEGIQFPKRAYGGAWNGKLIWGRLSEGRVEGMLKNPGLCRRLCARQVSIGEGYLCRRDIPYPS